MLALTLRQGETVVIGKAQIKIVEIEGKQAKFAS
jgi:sRNA-binding carbon storage regulator CsrA